MITPNRPQTAEDISGHYDELDRFYRELWGEHVHHGLWLTNKEKPEVAVEQLIDRIASDLELTSRNLVCDVGCGYGGTSRYLAKHHSVTVTGVTLSQAQYDFAVAQTNGSDNPSYAVQNWESNAFDDSSFDQVVSIECFSHIENKLAFFEQIHRVLRPGGRAVITIWLAGESPTPWQVRHLLEPICREGRLPSMLSQTECTEMLQSVGLKQLAFDELSKQVTKTWRICGRRLLWGVATKPSYWWFLLRAKSSHSIFLLTVYRILYAYKTGAMRYGIFVIEKPHSNKSDNG